MKLKILTADNVAQTSTMAAGGYCNILKAPKYAPNFVDKSSKREHPKLRDVQTACSTGTVAAPTGNTA